MTRAPVHYLTGRPMSACPKCGRLSGLAGVDGGPCLACTETANGGLAGEDVALDYRQRRRFDWLRRLCA